MRRLAAIIIGSALLFSAAQVCAQDAVRPVPKSGDLEIKVWTNKAEGKSFGQGEHIIVYFRANRDCYVTLYDLDTRGNINLIWPYEYTEPMYVEGGRLYTVPDYYDDYQLIVDGPQGTEYIQAVASLDRFEIPPWPSKFFEYEEYYPLHKDREAIAFLDYVNKRYFPIGNCGDRCATDLTSFEVRRNWEYDWDDYYGRNVYHHYYYDYYDPWDWCGTVYIGYPYGGEVWINGIFYGYAPLFVPRLVVGWYNVGIWYSGYWWWDSRLHVYGGGWYDYVCDDVRYKNDPKHYTFKPGRRQSDPVVNDKYEPDRRRNVYTKEGGYVSREVYKKEYANRTAKTVRNDSPYFKNRIDRDPANRQALGGSATKSRSERDPWREGGTSKKETVTSNKMSKSGSGTGTVGSSGAVRKPTTSGSERKKVSTYFGGTKTKKTETSGKSNIGGSGSKKGSSTSQPIFKPDNSSRKSSPGESSGGKRIKQSTPARKSPGSSSGKSSGYSAPKRVTPSSPKMGGSRGSTSSSPKTSGGTRVKGGGTKKRR
jgi:hypothetical protein